MLTHFDFKRKTQNSKKLINLLKAKDIDGILYTDCSIRINYDDYLYIPSLLISRNYGIVCIYDLENKDSSQKEEIQDFYYLVWESKLQLHKELTKQRKLIIPIDIMTCNDLSKLTENDFTINEDTFDKLNSIIKSLLVEFNATKEAEAYLWGFLNTFNKENISPYLKAKFKELFD